MPLTNPEIRCIDLNADLGEGCLWDEALLARITSASISCGAHAGDPEAIVATLRAARASRVVVGAHPGLPDREHFGRREWSLDSEQAESIVRDQVELLRSLAEPLGVPIRFLKPHGSVYNQAQRDPQIASGVVAAAGTLGLPILSQPGGAVEIEAARAGVLFVAEGFADRRYQPDGRLVPRSEPGSVLSDPDEIAAQVLRLVVGGFATICLHGDNPDALQFADLVRETLRHAGVTVAGFLDGG